MQFFNAHTPIIIRALKSLKLIRTKLVTLQIVHAELPGALDSVAIVGVPVFLIELHVAHCIFILLFANCVNFSSRCNHVATSCSIICMVS